MGHRSIQRVLFTDLVEKFGEPWKNFGQRICRNKFIREYLRKIQAGTCSQCGLMIRKGGQLHHLDYLHLCRSDEVPPDCKTCSEEAPDSFAACVRRLTLVHRRCHMFIHGVVETRAHRSRRRAE